MPKADAHGYSGAAFETIRDGERHSACRKQQPRLQTVMCATFETERVPFPFALCAAGTNHFWSNKGIMNSVPKMKGIITPKSAINGGL